MDKLIPLEFKPGINRQSTRYNTRIGWYTGDKVRFYDGKPESIRGYRKRSQIQFDGTARDILVWNDLEGLKYIGLGTECRLYVYDTVSIYDVTPARTVSGSVANLFNTSADSTRLVVSINTHGAASGDHVIFTSATTVGGNVHVSGEYDVSVIGLNSFAIDVASSAAATSASSGSAGYTFLLACGTSVAQQGLGWGAGAYGVSTYGTPRGSSSIILDLRQWSIDTYGEDMIAAPRKGAIYRWHVSAGVNVRAGVVTAAPSINNIILVSPEDRHVIAFGTHDFDGVYDPLLVRWSNGEDIDNWTAAVTNTAGSQRINGANKIMGALRSRGQILIWTDDTLHGMAFAGPPYTFSFRQLGTQCGLLSPHAAIDFNGRSFWMSNNAFYRYDGRVTQLDCPVLRFVFDDFNYNQKDKVFTGTNAEFSEVIWHYCSRNSNEVDRYVTHNTEDNSWSYGPTTFSVWFDKSVYDSVITAGTDGYIYDNEIVDYYLADGSIMPTCIETGDFDLPGLSDNDLLMFVDRVIPDFDFDGPSPAVQITFITKNYPGGPETTKGPYNITNDTDYVSLRLRGRQARMRITSESNGGWRLGTLRFRVKSDGKR
jgi:hypothetical protein